MSSKTALHKIMDYLSRRDHSALELRQKLSNTYEEHEIEIAIQNAQDNGWITAPEELSERVACELDAKLKGILFINQYLKEKGLPKIAPDWNKEIKKSQKLLTKKKSDDIHARYRYLANRGYAEETIKKVIYEKPQS